MDASWKLLMDLLDKISELHDQHQWYEIAVHFGLVIKIGLVITICGALVVGLSFAFYMVAKISLALVLMIGPVFLGLPVVSGNAAVRDQLDRPVFEPYSNLHDVCSVG